MIDSSAMANIIAQYAKIHAALVKENKQITSRLKDIDRALAGKSSAPGKEKAARKTRKKRTKASPGTIAKMKAAAKKRWAVKKKKPAKKKK